MTFNQLSIAKDQMRDDYFINQESRIAVLKIQSFQFAIATPEVGSYYQQQALKMVTDSLLKFVSNHFVLKEEGYFGISHLM